MAENDLLLLASEYQNRIWLLSSWWVSITVALFTLGYIVGKKISLFQLIFILMTYILYTINVVRNIGRVSANIANVINDLREIQSSGAELSNVSQQLLIGYREIGTFIDSAFFLAAPALLFFGAHIYLVSQYRTGQKALRKGT